MAYTVLFKCGCTKLHHGCPFSQEAYHAIGKAMNQTIVRSTLLFPILLGIIMTVTACCDRQPKEQSKIAAATPSTPPVPAALPPVFYPATLAEGMDFAKPGYPNFIDNVSGLFNQEPWGRWTDGDKAIFHFKQPFPKQFTLVIKTNVFGPNFGEVVTVKIGGIQQQFKITEQGQSHHFDFILTEPADTIEFLIPKPTSPHELDPSNSDKRKLGLGLISLKIT